MPGMHTSIFVAMKVCTWSGSWFEPLWKIWKSIGMIIPNIWENEKWQPNHQPVIISKAIAGSFERQKNCLRPPVSISHVGIAGALQQLFKHFGVIHHWSSDDPFVVLQLRLPKLQQNQLDPDGFRVKDLIIWNFRAIFQQEPLLKDGHTHASGHRLLDLPGSFTFIVIHHRENLPRYGRVDATHSENRTTGAWTRNAPDTCHQISISKAGGQNPWSTLVFQNSLDSCGYPPCRRCTKSTGVHGNQKNLTLLQYETFKPIKNIVIASCILQIHHNSFTLWNVLEYSKAPRKSQASQKSRGQLVSSSKTMLVKRWETVPNFTIGGIYRPTK